MSALAGRDVALAALFALVACSFYGATCLHANFDGTIADAAVYLVLADHFSPWREVLPDLGPFAFRRYPFPPLYPLLLGWAGGGSTAPIASYAFGAATLGAALGAALLWLRRAGMPLAAAAALTGLMAVLPTTLLTALDVASEPLYLLLSLSGLIALAAPPSARRGLLAALAIGLAACTRTAGIALLAAFAIAWPARVRAGSSSTPAANAGTGHAEPVRTFLACGPPALAFAPPIGWAFVKHVSGYPGYALGAVDAAHLSSIVATNARALATAAMTSFDLAPGARLALPIAALGIAAAVGWARAVRRWDCAALYLALYLAMLIVWPHPAHARRFLFVLMPLLIAYAYTGAVRLAGARAAGGAMAIAILFVIAAPGVRGMIADLTSGEPARRSPAWYYFGSAGEARRVMAMDARLFRFLHESAAAVPAESCVSTPLPQYVLLYAHRRAEQLPPIAVGDRALAAALERCPYVMMMAVGDYPPSGMPAMYPFASIKDRMSVLGVAYMHPESRDGTVLAMLARLERPRGRD